MSIIVPRGTPTSPVAPAAPQAAPTLATAPEAAAPAVEEQISPKFAALARQQKEIRRMQLDIKAREDALKAKEAEYQTSYIPKSRIKEDLMGVLSEEGISHDEYLAMVANQNPQEMEFKKLYKKIEEVDSKTTRAQEEAKAQQQKAYDQAVNKIRNETKLLIDKDDTFEVIKANEAYEDVVQLIIDHHAESGEILSVEAACIKKEEELLEQVMKFASLGKVKKRLNPDPATETAEVPMATQTTKQITPQKTLTNAATTGMSKPLSAREKRERAILAFKGQLS